MVSKPIKTPKSEPSMEDLLRDFGSKIQGRSVGARVKGKVISIESKRVLVDIGGKSEGLVAEKAYNEAEDYIKTLSPGDEVEGVVLVSETQDGYTILSLRPSAQRVSWEKIAKAYETGESIKVEGRALNPSGVLVDVEGISGFIPTSQLGKEAAKNPQKLIKEKFGAVVIDFNKEVNKVILSERQVSDAEELKMARDALKDIKEGEVFEGIVTTIYDFGCFVRISAPTKQKTFGKKKTVSLEGLVHISELSWDKVDKPDNVVSTGDKVKVKVIGKRNDKLALSIKQIQGDPWERALVKYKKDDRVKGKVVKVSDFGVFVQLEPGLEGLVHMTKIPPGTKLSGGDEVNVYIEEININEKRISLGLVLSTKPVGYK